MHSEQYVVCLENDGAVGEQRSGWRVYAREVVATGVGAAIVGAVGGDFGRAGRCR